MNCNAPLGTEWQHLDFETNARAGRPHGERADIAADTLTTTFIHGVLP